MAGSDRSRRLLRKLRDAVKENAPPPAGNGGIDWELIRDRLHAARDEAVNEERIERGLPPLPERTPEERAAERKRDREKERRENAVFYAKYPDATEWDRMRFEEFGTTPEGR